MGLTLLVNECQAVFDVITAVYAAFPYAIKILIFASFGGAAFIMVLKSIWG